MTADTAGRSGGYGRTGAGGSTSTYELFMGILTLLSLGVMAWLLFASNEQIQAILVATDTVFCLVFLLDFVRSLRLAPDKSAYLLGPRPGRSLPEGVLDLLGSTPAVGAFRIFRVFRLLRIRRLLTGRTPSQLIHDFVAGRASSALYVVALVAILVILFGSTAIVYAEQRSPDANIVTGSDAVWWAFVTITTVGYGDRFPVTEIGRLIGALTMAVGIGVFGVFTSYLATVFMASPSAAEEPASSTEPDAAQPSAASAVMTTAGSADREDVDTLSSQLSTLQAEIRELRRLLEGQPPR